MNRRGRQREPRIMNPSQHTRRYVSLVVAAEYLEVNRKTLNAYIEEGLLAAYQFGARRRVRAKDLVEFEERQRVRKAG